MFFPVFSLFSLLLFPNFPPPPPSTIVSKNSSENRTFLLSPRSTPPPAFLPSCLGVVFARRSTEAAPARRIISISIKIEAKREIKFDDDADATDAADAAADAADAADAAADVAADAADAQGVEEERREEEEREADEEEQRASTPGKSRLFARQKNENNNKNIHEHLIKGRGT